MTAAVRRAPLGATRLELIALVQFLGTGMLLSGVPRYLREELGASRTAVGIATTIFFVGALAVRPALGRALDRYGRRRFFRWSLAGLTILTIGLELSSTVVAVGALRLVQGAFGAAFYTSIATMTADVAPPDKRGSAVGRLSFATYLGFVFGPLIADVVIPFGFSALWAVVTVAMAGALTLAWSHPETRPELAPGEVRSRPPLIHPAVIRPGLAQAAVSFALSATTAFSPEFAGFVGIDRPGTLFSAYAVTVLFVRVPAGRASDRLGAHVVAIPALALGAVALVVLSQARAPWWAYLAMGVVGIGMGAVFPAMTALAVDRAPPAERGAALGSFLAFNDIGQALAGPLAGVASDAGGIRWAFGLPAIVVAGGFLVALGLRPRRSAAG
ncbi:MAG: MFS transporter [Acidimicrobiales bacterium]